MAATDKQRYKHSLFSVYLLSQVQVFCQLELKLIQDICIMCSYQGCKRNQVDKQIQEHSGSLKMFFATRWRAECWA